jgi:hypothetical protein
MRVSSIMFVAESYKHEKALPLKHMASCSRADALL